MLVIVVKYCTCTAAGGQMQSLPEESPTPAVWYLKMDIVVVVVIDIIEGNTHTYVHKVCYIILFLLV